MLDQTDSVLTGRFTFPDPGDGTPGWVAGRRLGLGRARYHVVQNEEGRMAPGWDVAGHNKRGGLHKLCDGPRCPEFRSPT